MVKVQPPEPCKATACFATVAKGGNVGAMKNTILTAVALSALAVAPSAKADWQNTRWGMTPQEVIEATGARPETGRSIRGGSLEAAGEYSAAGFDFRSRFFFASGGLRVVALTLLDPSDCPLLNRALSGIYGEPMESRDSATRWASTSDNFYVLINEPWEPYSSECVVYYEPISAGSVSGL